MSEIVITGERFIPESNDAELELEHMQRYYAACGFVKGKVVLDAACGEGYGSYLMAQKAKKVIGIDLDEETVSNAKARYAEASNIEYVQGNIAKLDFIESSSIDTVVSFETIEHVSAQIQLDFISEIKRVLKPDGILIMSSPNKKEYTDRYEFHNKFHVHELYVDEFVELLRTRFQNIRLYRQYLEVVSMIDRADADEERIRYCKNSKKYNPQGKYVIAVAGSQELPGESLSMASLHLREEYLPTLDELNYCRSEIIKCRNRIKQLEADVHRIREQKQANELKLSNEELSRRAEELEHRMNLINQLRAENAMLKNELKLSAEELDRRAAELAHRMDVINESARELERMKKQLPWKICSAFERVKGGNRN